MAPAVIRQWIALGVSVSLHALAFRLVFSELSPDVVAPPNPRGELRVVPISVVSLSVSKVPTMGGKAHVRQTHAARKGVVAGTSLARSDANGAESALSGVAVHEDQPQGDSPSNDAAPSIVGTASDESDIANLVYTRLVEAAEGCYPPAARRFHQQGTVQLSFCIGDAGQVTRATVLRSSGIELLDRAAQGCVLLRAQPLPASASDRCFELPARFGLRPQ